MLSPKHLFLSLSGSGAVGLLACWLTSPVALDAIPDIQNSKNKSDNHNLAELSSNTDVTFLQSGKEIEEGCGKYIWDSESEDTKNPSHKNLKEYMECEKQVDKNYYPNIVVDS